MQLNFSFKTVKEDKLEKYPNTPVLTFIESTGVVKFALNKKAFELLGFSETEVNKINFAHAEGNLFLANTYGKEESNICNVNKDKTINNKKLYDRINKHFGIEVLAGSEFILKTIDEDLGFPVLLITDSSPESFTTDEFAHIDDNEFEESYQETEVTEENLMIE